MSPSTASRVTFFSILASAMWPASMTVCASAYASLTAELRVCQDVMCRAGKRT